MAPKKSGRAAVNDEAGCRAGTASPYSEKRVKSPPETFGVTYQRVTGSVGPIHLIGGSRVVIERYPSRAFVWVENPIWGWPDARREFLNPASPAIRKYAEALALSIRGAPLAEEARRERVGEARKYEAAARLAEWEARK